MAVAEAVRRQVPVIPRAEMLAELVRTGELTAEQAELAAARDVQEDAVRALDGIVFK